MADSWLTHALTHAPTQLEDADAAGSYSGADAAGGHSGPTAIRSAFLHGTLDAPSPSPFPTAASPRSLFLSAPLQYLPAYLPAAPDSRVDFAAGATWSPFRHSVSALRPLCVRSASVPCPPCARLIPPPHSPPEPAPRTRTLEPRCRRCSNWGRMGFPTARPRNSTMYLRSSDDPFVSAGAWLPCLARLAPPCPARNLPPPPQPPHPTNAPARLRTYLERRRGRYIVCVCCVGRASSSLAGLWASAPGGRQDALAVPCAQRPQSPAHPAP